MSSFPDVSSRPESTAPGVPALRLRLPEQRHPRTGAPQDAPRWQRRFSLAVALGDLMTIAVVVTVAVLAGLTSMEAADRARIGTGLIAAGLLALALPACRAWDGRVFGQGSAEFVQLVRASASTTSADADAGCCRYWRSAPRKRSPT